MRNIIDWLIEFEVTASKFYDNAVKYFPEDPALATLLTELAADERYHAFVIREASEALLENQPPADLLKLDIESKKKVEGRIKECVAALSAGTITKKEFLEYIVKLEYSEWNTLFVYIANSLKNISKELSAAPKKMQLHKQRIANYIKGMGEEASDLEELIMEINKIVDLWRERFLLVVDDDDTIASLLTAILESKGDVETASNGKEALAKVHGQYYHLIISDMSMPVMTGREFYELAVKQDPDIKGKVLFFTGSGSQENLDFFHENDIKYILKPASLDVIIDGINEILK